MHCQQFYDVRARSRISLSSGGDVCRVSLLHAGTARDQGLGLGSVTGDVSMVLTVYGNGDGRCEFV